jgi:hypothetical protein
MIDMDDTPFEHIVAWGRHYQEETLQAQDEREISDYAYRRLSEMYAPHVDLRMMGEDQKQGYLASCKLFSDYCATLIPDMAIRCLPPRPGIVAAFLHESKLDGATHSELKRHAEAIRYLANLNETADPTDDPLVQAILKSADPKGPLERN